MLKFTPFVFTLILISVISHAASFARIGPSLQESLNRRSPLNIVVTFKEGTSSVLQTLPPAKQFLTRTEKINRIVSALKAHTRYSQKHVLDFLNKSRPLLKFKSFWITNQAYIKGADKLLIEELSKFQEISSLGLERSRGIENVFPEYRDASEVQSDPPGPGWGLTRMRVEKVWSAGINGTNIVVASLDTGVRGTHESLRNNYIGDHGWYEPSGSDSVVPSDGRGHGTHVTGSMVGHGGIGVAPGAKWMACRICYDGATCFYGDFLACGQFMLCPTEPDGVSNPDCSKAPHVINNSWAIDPIDDGWGFDDVIEAWHAAGIIPVASVGNGNLCNQIGYPATKENMIGVGNSAMDNRASDSSSRGPAIDGSIKPDISAPGDYILSASSSADDVYILMSGTSMATPNTAGVIALLLSYKPDLTFNQVRQYLYDGASLNYRLTGQDCGNIVETRVPNNAFGHGIVDAFGSYQLLLADFPRVK